MFFHIVPYLNELRDSIKIQWISPTSLKKMQEEKLRCLLLHAYHKVSYYQKLFDRQGIKPKDIISVGDLVKIPITTRKDLQVCLKKEIISQDLELDRCINLRTSGSTGMPLDIMVSAREIALRKICYRRMYFENGGRIQDRELSITTPRNFSRNRWFENFGVLRKKCISVFEDIEFQLKKFLEFKPDIIGGHTYASAIKNLVSEIKSRKIKLKYPRIIFSTGDAMTQKDREFIVSIFNTQLLDYYACNECGIIGWECIHHKGYHINSDHVIVEFLKEDGTSAKPGEEGKIVITNLNSYVMPFIRYCLGDIGMFSNEECPCGRTLPLLKIISGRTNDFVFLENGKKLSPYILMSAMDKIKAVHKYKIVQEEKKKIKIMISFEEALPKNEITLNVMEIIKIYKKILGKDMNIEVITMKEMISDKSGKYKHVISRLS